MLIVKFSNKFKKDYKLAEKRGLDINILKKVVDMLANQQPLPSEYREHYLSNNYKRLQGVSPKSRLVINISNK